jgi:hypothetical protein
MTGFAWTKMPSAIVAESLALTKWGIGNCVQSVTKAAAPAARNSGKMICGQRELLKRSDYPFEDYEYTSEFVTQWMNRQ